MKQFNNVKRGQALLFVFFLLLIVGILAGALANMWEAEIKTRASGRDSLIAFYLAQAGVERAKIELAYDETWTGGGPYSFGGGTYTVSVQNVACPPGPYNTCREITSTGRIASAERRITCRVSLDRPPLDPPNTPGDEEMVPWSWREI
jgi:Tfp pilus assembly protein PilX